jgi:hypothetical protein
VEIARKDTLNQEGADRSRDAVDLQAYNPLFQRTSTRAPRRLSVQRAFTREPANVAFHDASSASDRLSARRGGVLLRLCSRTGFPLTLHSDRFPPDRMNGFGLRRPRAPSIANGFSGEPEGQSTTSATDVKVEHTRERLVTPRAGVLSADGWPSKACGRQSTGYPAGSRAPALPVTSTRPSFGTSAREACSNRSWAPLSGSGTGRKPGEGSSVLRAPRPAFDLPRER